MNGYRTLVLNSAFMPVSLFPMKTIPAEDAITRVLTGGYTVILNHDAIIKTESRHDLYWPSIIMSNGGRYSDKVGLKRESLYYRDHGICQYCEKPLSLNTLTMDHVVPKTYGGFISWENVVAACQDCNSRKGHKEAKGQWKPKQLPFEPTFGQMLEIRKKFPLIVYDERWPEFLPKWNSEIICERV